MKKILALLIVLTMIIGAMPVVSADTTGYVAFDANVVKNSYCVVKDESDDFFGTVRQATSSGNMKVDIKNSVPCAMNSGEYVYVTFYYKTDTATAPGSFYAYGSANSTSGKLQFGYADTAGEWVRAGFFISLSTALTPSGDSDDTSDDIIVRLVSPSSSGKIITIAEPKMIYTGSSKDVTDLQSTSITGITVAGTAVNLTENPTSCTAPAVVGASDIEVTTTFGTADKVIVEESADGASLNVKVYAPAVDYRAEDAVPSATYTINRPAASEFTFNPEYAMHSQNIAYTGGINRVAENNAWVDTLTGDETSGTNFDTIYTYNTKAGTNSMEGTLSNKNNFMCFVGDSTEYPAEGDWVYIKFYVRSLSSYTDENGNTVTGNTLRLYPRFNGVVINTNGVAYFNTSSDTWREYEYIIQVSEAMAAEERWELRFANIIAISEATAEDSTVTTTATFNDAQAQVAGLQILNIGKPVVTSGTPSDAEIEEKINQLLGTYGLTGVYRSDSEDNLYDVNSNPLTITAGPRYIAGVDSFDVTGSTIFGENTADVVKNGNTYTISSYAPNYDWINGTGGKEQYVVNVVPEYDFYDFELDGLTLSLKGDNNLDDPKSGVIIGVSYDSTGKLLKLNSEPFSIQGKANNLSVTVPEASGVASLKFFIWDGIATSIPYVKTIVVNDLTTGEITQ